MSYLSPKRLAQVVMKADIDREPGGLLHLLFRSAYHPNYLPDNTPQEIVSAWLRLHEARKDIALIERWLDEPVKGCSSSASEAKP